MYNVENTRKVLWFHHIRAKNFYKMSINIFCKTASWHCGGMDFIEFINLDEDPTLSA